MGNKVSEEALAKILKQFDQGVPRKKLVGLISNSFEIDANQPVIPQIETSIERSLTHDESFKVQLMYEEARLARNPAARTLNGLR